MSVMPQQTKQTQVGDNETTTETHSYEDVRKVVLDWPVSLRAALIHEIVNSLAQRAEVSEQRPKKDTLSKALGILRGEGPPPTDEEIQQLLDERRMRKAR